MQTRGGAYYPSAAAINDVRVKCKRKRHTIPLDREGDKLDGKRLREESSIVHGGVDHFDRIPDDLLIFVLAKLSGSVKCPADFINVLLTCRRFHALGFHPMVLARASRRCFCIRASRWGTGAHNFMKQCADAGNIEASYILGMIRFYCLKNRRGGTALMANAAVSSHAAALHSLAIIQFNGSGGSRKDKDLKAGVALCARSAILGHVDALRELGHCLQDGYGVTKNIAEGRRLLVQANARELASILPGHYRKAHDHAHAHAHDIRCIEPSLEPWLKNLNGGGNRRHSVSVGNHVYALVQGSSRGCPLLSDFGCDVPPQELHPANKFLVEWFSLRPPHSGLRLCSHGACGRPETRKHEFRRCSVCGTVNYCSRACQALDWKIRHNHNCTPMEDWLEVEHDDADMDEEEVGIHPQNYN